MGFCCNLTFLFLFSPHSRDVTFLPVETRVVGSVCLFCFDRICSFCRYLLLVSLLFLNMLSKVADERKRKNTPLLYTDIYNLSLHPWFILISVAVSDFFLFILLNQKQLRGLSEGIYFHLLWTLSEFDFTRPFKCDSWVVVQPQA